MQMDPQGWIPLAVISNFNRVRMLTPNLLLIIESLADSKIVEVSADMNFLRAKETWTQWVAAQPPVAAQSKGTIAATGADVVPMVTSSTGEATPQLPAVTTQPLMAGGTNAAAALASPVAAAAAAAAAASSLSRSKPAATAAPPPRRPVKSGDDDDAADEEEDLFEMDEDQVGREHCIDNGGQATFIHHSVSYFLDSHS